MRERLDIIDIEHVLSFRKQCEILSVHRSGLYYKSQREKKDNLEIMLRVILRLINTYLHHHKNILNQLRKVK